MVTERGVFVPDHLQFRDGVGFMITVYAGRTPDESGRRLRPYATLADLTSAAKCVDVFCNDILQQIYGRGWHRRNDISFSVLAVPETRKKGRGDRCPLHFHILIDGTGFSDLSDATMEELAKRQWSELALRQLTFVPQIGVQRLRQGEDAKAYVMKWVDKCSPHERAMIEKRQKRNPACCEVRTLAEGPNQQPDF